MEKILELLTKLDDELPNYPFNIFWYIEVLGDGSGKLFAPIDQNGLTNFNNLEHLTKILEALLENASKKTTEEYVRIINEVNDELGLA